MPRRNRYSVVLWLRIPGTRRCWMTSPAPSWSSKISPRRRRSSRKQWQCDQTSRRTRTGVKRLVILHLPLRATMTHTWLCRRWRNVLQFCQTRPRHFSLRQQRMTRCINIRTQNERIVHSWRWPGANIPIRSFKHATDSSPWSTRGRASPHSKGGALWSLNPGHRIGFVAKQA